MQGKNAGAVLVSAGIGIGVLGVVILLAMMLFMGVGIPGFIAGLVILAIVVIPIIVAGVILRNRGEKDAAKAASAQKQRQLYEMVQARGKLTIPDAVFELGSTVDQVKEWIYNLVGLGIFNGYINWDDGVLYSAEAANLRDLSECKRCGGTVSLAGKGVSACEYCGTEYFLS